MHHNVIAVFKDHENAVNEIDNLINAGFKAKEMSLIGVLNAQDNFESQDATKAAETLSATSLVGTVLGTLTGIGIFAIPGLGFLYGAGALIGGIAGLDLGLISGGFISALLLGDEKKEIASIYDEYLKNDKTLLIFRGHDSDNEKVFQLLKQSAQVENVQQH